MADHPSGRPVRGEEEPLRKLGFTRPVREDFLSPGLRRKEFDSVDAIGFHHHIVGEDE